MRLLPALLVAPVMLVASCDQAPPVFVNQAVIRLNPNPDAPSAAYFSIETGNAPVTLRGIECPAAVRAEMHMMAHENGMMVMKPVSSVDIPADSTMKFEPGGRHVMLWSLNPQVVATGKVPMTLIFSNGDRIVVEALVQKPGG